MTNVALIALSVAIIFQQLQLWRAEKEIDALVDHIEFVLDAIKRLANHNLTDQLKKVKEENPQ